MSVVGKVNVCKQLCTLQKQRGGCQRRAAISCASGRCMGCTASSAACSSDAAVDQDQQLTPLFCTQPSIAGCCCRCCCFWQLGGRLLSSAAEGSGVTRCLPKVQQSQQHTQQVPLRQAAKQLHMQPKMQASMASPVTRLMLPMPYQKIPNCIQRWSATWEGTWAWESHAYMRTCWAITVCVCMCVAVPRHDHLGGSLTKKRSILAVTISLRVNVNESGVAQRFRRHHCCRVCRCCWRCTAAAFLPGMLRLGIGAANAVICASSRPAGRDCSAGPSGAGARRPGSVEAPAPCSTASAAANAAAQRTMRCVAAMRGTRLGEAAAGESRQLRAQPVQFPAVGLLSGAQLSVL